MYTDSSWHEQSSYEISNCLVVIFGIGEYDGVNDLSGISQDYKNLVSIFYKQFGYSIEFFGESNKLIYCNKEANKQLNQIKLKGDINKIEYFIKTKS